MFELKKREGTVIASRMRTAEGGGLFGLMLRRKMDEDEALVFRVGGRIPEAVHTFFLTFPVDLVFTDETMRITEIRTHLLPWRVYLPKTRPAYLVELPAGKSAKAGLRVGDSLWVEKVISGKKQKE